MILLIDNYDSFSYNLFQAVGAIDPDVTVIRNDAMDAREIEKMAPEKIILSPGPGYPKDSGVCLDVVRSLAGKIPILGVCLGHQGICEVCGAKIGHAPRLMHGKSSMARLDLTSPIFRGLPAEIQVGRYHSLAADPATLPKCLKVTAETEEGEIMAVEHKEYPVFGLQFHPESILTPLGPKIIQNFLEL